MKRKLETKKGITLISLVITIIIMIILATVAINLAVDGNGLFRRAGDTANIWNNSVAQEGSTIGNLLLMADKVGGASFTPPTSIVEVTRTETAVAVKATGGTASANGVAGYKYSIDNENWSDTIAEEETYTINYATINTVANEYDTTKIPTVVGEGTRKAPIPAGYTVSGGSTENTISQGLVIYENTNRVIPTIYAKTVDTAGNESEAYKLDNRTQYNQFVWIPVDDIDYMVMCKLNNANDDGTVCSLELDNGKLRCMTHNATEENTTELCGRVYSTTASSETVDGKKVYTYNMSFTAEERATQKWDTSSYREPDIVSSADTLEIDDTSIVTYAGITSGKVEDFQKQLEDDFVAMAESVAKYGGFYVSRYEAGENGASKNEQQVMVAGTSTLTGSTSGTYIEEDNMWYGMYKKLREGAGINKEAVSSHMIWGCQYDMVISFLSEKASNDPFTGHTNRQLAAQGKTGANSADVMSNVYDLEGNNVELTARAYSDASRDSRGGNFSNVAFFSWCLIFPTSGHGVCPPGMRVLQRCISSDTFYVNLPTGSDTLSDIRQEGIETLDRGFCL